MEIVINLVSYFRDLIGHMHIKIQVYWFVNKLLYKFDIMCGDLRITPEWKDSIIKVDLCIHDLQLQGGLTRDESIGKNSIKPP